MTQSPEPSKTFRAYLQDQIEEGSPIGDLARDSFPGWQGYTADSLTEYMKSRSASREAFQALEEAKEDFEQQKRRF